MPFNKRITIIDSKFSINFFFLAIVLLFLITRLTHLTALPIFNDEAIYISWAKMIKEDIHNILLPLLVESKKPLLMWLITLFLNIFQDSLWASRFVSVIAGFFSLIGIYLIGIRIHSESVGYLSALFYAVSPYFLFYDRMAHQDSLLNCFFVWLLLLSLIIFQHKEKIKVPYFGALGFVIGLSLLAKSSAILFVFLPFLLKLIFLKKSTFVAWKSLFSSYIFGLLIAASPYVSLFLLTSANFSIKNILIPTQTSLGQKSLTGILVKIPENIYQSIDAPVDYFITYLTLPVFFVAGIFFIFQFSIFNKKYFILLLFFFIPFITTLGIGGEGFSRYYLFCGIPIVLWAALAFNYGVSFLKKRFSRKTFYGTIFFLSLIFLFPSLFFNYRLLTKPSEAPFIGRDYSQYVSSKFSGYGIPEALDYFKKVSGEKKITIFTSSNWGNPADAIYVHLSDDPNIKVYTAFWVFKSELLPSGVQKIKLFQRFTGKGIDVIDVSNPSEIYFICRSPDFKRNAFLQINRNFQLVRSFRKPNSTIFIDIYKRI